MSKRVFILVMCALLLASVLQADWRPSAATAQNRKPSQVLKQVAEQQFKLLNKFDTDVSEGRAQLDEWESRADSLRQFAAEQAAGFKIVDWKGDELLALATLYQSAEMFAAVADAYRAYLAADPKPRAAGNARLGLTRALIEDERIEEAQKLLDEIFRQMPDGPSQLAGRVALHKDLAVAWRERGKYDVVMTQAKRGYDLADNNEKFQQGNPRIIETMERDRMTLAAAIVAAQERLGFQKEAGEFNKQVNRGLDRQPELKSFYEAELAVARLFGASAPELAASRWLDGVAEIAPKKLSDLRGKVVLLSFWAMWRSSSTGEFPRLADFQKKFGGKGFEIIGVTRFYGRSDTQDDLSRPQEWKSLQNYKSKYRLDYPIAVGKIDDLTNDERYGIAGLPTVILIDRSGNVRHIKRGAGEYRKLEKQIEKLVNE